MGETNKDKVNTVMERIRNAGYGVDVFGTLASGEIHLGVFMLPNPGEEYTIRYDGNIEDPGLEAFVDTIAPPIHPDSLAEQH